MPAFINIRDLREAFALSVGFARIWLAVASLSFTAEIFAAEPNSIEQRLRRLEEKVDTLQNENAALRRELGRAAGEAPTVAPAGKETKLVIGGFTQG